jgi:hypothetical protein
VFVSHFEYFSVFSPYSRSYSLHFHFSWFSVYLSFFLVIQFLYLIFNIVQFSRHYPCPKVNISHFRRFSLFLAMFQVLKCAFLIFHVCQCFLPCSRSYIVCVSFSTFFSVFSPYSRSYSVHFSFSTFFSAVFAP